MLKPTNYQIVIKHNVLWDYFMHNGTLCSYWIKMDENGAQESSMDFYAQFNSLKALEKKFSKSNHWFSLAVQSPAGRESLIAKLGLFGWH